jgi:hypothetical protein
MIDGEGLNRNVSHPILVIEGIPHEANKIAWRIEKGRSAPLLLLRVASTAGDIEILLSKGRNFTSDSDGLSLALCLHRYFQSSDRVNTLNEALDEDDTCGALNWQYVSRTAVRRAVLVRAGVSFC